MIHRRILYHDNKRRRPLRKAGCYAHATRTSCAGSRFISLSLFSLSRCDHTRAAHTTRCAAGQEKENRRRVQRDTAELPLDSPRRTNDPFRTCKSLNSTGPAFVTLFPFFPRVAENSLLSLAKYCIRTFPRTPVSRNGRDYATSNNCDCHH